MSRNRRPIQAKIRTPTDGPTDGFGDRLREALSHWASGVAIVAVTDGEEIDAITATAFCALSFDPPLVLACLGEQASLLPMLREEGSFTVSILSAEQRSIAGSVAQRLPGSDAHFASLGEPHVPHALARIDCELHAEYPGGDHRIIVGAVTAVGLGPDQGPLLYYRRGYCTVQ